MRKKDGFSMALDQLGWAIIILGVLVIIVIAIFILNQHGINLFDKIQDIFRFGR